MASLRDLGFWLAVLGGLGLMAGAGMLAFPAAVRRGFDAFPRSKAPGWILTAIGVFWVSWVIYHASLGRFDVLKPAVPVGAVVLFGAMVLFLDELLAPRALGGLLLLLANPMLMGVRWADSAWRYVVVLIAYAWVIAGCALMLHPWVFRKMADRFLGSERVLRRMGWLKLAGSAVLLAAGFWHLR